MFLAALASLSLAVPALPQDPRPEIREVESLGRGSGGRRRRGGDPPTGPPPPPDSGPPVIGPPRRLGPPSVAAPIETGGPAATILGGIPNAAPQWGRPTTGGVVPGSDSLLPISPSAVPGVAGGAGFDSPWRLWWRLAEAEWLVAERASVEGRDPHLRPAPIDDGPRRSSSQTELEAARVRSLSPMQAALGDANALVRREAAIALGRLGGEGAREALLEALADASDDVRRASILALGATGSERAVHALLRLAHHGTRPDGLDAGPEAEELAVLALALARDRGAGRGAELLLPSAEPGSPLADAIAMHQLVAPSAELAPRVRELSGLFPDRRKRRRGADLHPRAIEALRADAPEEVLAALEEAIGARDVGARRSAALALGEVDDARAASLLAAAVAQESEALTRGFGLVALGRRGGDEAREFLLHAVRRGSSSARAWCALALGLLAREADDAGARDTLREGYLRQRNQETRAAFLIALGLSRDPQATPILRHELRLSRSTEERALAATALALGAQPEALAELRAALSKETSPPVRSAIARALGSLGDPVDAPLLVEILAEPAPPEELTLRAEAVGLLACSEAADLLTAMLDDADTLPATRAAALRALGMTLDARPPHRLRAIARSVDFTTLPAWVGVPLASSL